MSTLVAVLDTDVLVPILSCDLLLSAFDEDLYRPVITATILDETERNLVDGFTRLDPIALRGRVAQVAAALSHHTHDEGDVTAAAVATVNRKDRHVAATALAHGANLVVSNDRGQPTWSCAATPLCGSRPRKVGSADERSTDPRRTTQPESTDRRGAT